MLRVHFPSLEIDLLVSLDAVPPFCTPQSSIALSTLGVLGGGKCAVELHKKARCPMVSSFLVPRANVPENMPHALSRASCLKTCPGCSRRGLVDRDASSAANLFGAAGQDISERKGMNGVESAVVGSEGVRVTRTERFSDHVAR